MPIKPHPTDPDKVVFVSHKPILNYDEIRLVRLTEQQIKSLLSDSACWIGDDCSMPNLNYIIRAVEKAHGIGEK